MIYVTSDLHGRYDKYQAMLQKIGFSDDDTLYIGGDICDRGEDSVKIYLDVMERKNVIVIKGNHEDMMQTQFDYLQQAYPDGNIGVFDLFSDRHLFLWFHNGGDATLVDMFAEPAKTQHRILEFVRALPHYATVEVNGKRYVLVHGGLGDFPEGTALEDVPHYDLLWSRPDFNRNYFNEENTRLIVGHTPTFTLHSAVRPATIYRGEGDVIGIDCGAAYPQYLGRLGCLCLDTGEEFYV